VWRINDFGAAGSDLGGERSLLVHNRVFTRVYYNNGNSLPVSSIPTSWGHFDQVRKPADRCCVSSFSFTTANRTIDSVFVGDVRAPHLLKAGLRFSKRGLAPEIQAAFAIHVQDG